MLNGEATFLSGGDVVMKCLQKTLLAETKSYSGNSMEASRPGLAFISIASDFEEQIDLLLKEELTLLVLRQGRMCGFDAGKGPQPDVRQGPPNTPSSWHVILDGNVAFTQQHARPTY